MTRNISLGAAFAEGFKKSIRNILKKPVFEKGDGNWLDVLPSKTKQNNNRKHSSTILTPIQASLKKNEGFGYQNLLDKRNKIKPKYKIGDIVRTADLKRTFSKRDTNNWSYNLYTVTEISNDTVPSYRIDNLQERYNEALLKKIELTTKENDTVMKKLNIN